jgi:nickel/cobalt exporter
MKKLILLLFLFQNLLFGCATCQLMIPTAELKIDVDMNATKLQNIHITWNFSDMYSAEILRQYDKNKNNKLDKSELNIVLKAMLDYLTPKNMVTRINYANEDENAITIKPVYKNFTMQIENGFLVFYYDAVVDVNVQNKSTLSFSFEDDEAYFGFVILDVNLHGTQLHHTQNIYLFTASLLFSDTALEKSAPSIANPEPTEVKKEIKVEEIKEPSTQANILKESIIKIKSLFESIKDEKNPLSYLLLLFFAYLYGLIHALGPGHGKTLVASYFLSNQRSYSKALYVSLAIGVVHTFSAFLLTLIIYFMVNSFLAQFMSDTVFYTTKISALIIISIALYLIYTKYKAYKQLRQASEAPAFKFSTTPHVATCACASCKVENNSTDMALIISAGIIPCPGTTTIFIFAISLGLYYAGFLSALVMSLGMSTIIFFSALLSVAIRKKSENSNSNFKKYLEYASLCVILVLGFILLFV